jgi:hypothetical protein
MKKMRHIKQKHPKFSLVIGCAALLTTAGVMTYLISEWRSSSVVWLPENAEYASASDDQLLFDVIVRSDNVITKYGQATRFTSTDNWQKIYEFHSSPLLKSSSCPNITNFETVLPSGCQKLGNFKGEPVYTIHRSLPSGATEYYVKLGATFVYIMSGGDGGQSLDYLKTFVSLSRDNVGSYLADNSKRVNAVKAKQQADQKTTNQNNDVAYTRLDFTPAIPKNLPSGWQLNKNTATNPVALDGPDADHPNMVNIDYTNSNNEQFVSLHVGKLSNFRITTQCGPSPGYSMEDLACHKVAGTDYYEATLYDERNDFVRYLYRPVGDSLVISQIVAYAEGDMRPNRPTELIKIQDAITLNAEPTDKSNLKGSSYYKLYY